MTIPRSGRINPEPRGPHLPSSASWLRLSAALILVAVAAAGGMPPVAQASSANTSLRGVGRNVCNAGGSAQGLWSSTHELADALRARPSAVGSPGVTISGAGGFPGVHVAHAADLCDGAFFDRWSQTWFTRSAGRIAALPICPVPGRPDDEVLSDR